MSDDRSTPPTRPVLPPPAAEGSGTAATPITVDWQRLVRGNWLGAGLVALATAATAGFLGLLLALLAKPADFGLDNTLTLATLFATGAFGADAQMETSATGFFGGHGEGSLASFPFTITLAALVVGTLLFRRVTRGYPSGGAAVADAARAAVLFAILLWIPALVFTSTNDEMGRGWAGDLSAESMELEVRFSASAGGALGLGFLVLFTVLALACLIRRDWWTGRILRVHDWVAAPLRGWTLFTLLLPVAGLIGYLAMGFTVEDPADAEITNGEARLTVAFVLAFLANGGLALLGLGAASKVGTTAEGEGESESEWSRLWGPITDEEVGLWVAPVVLVALLAICAFIVMRKAGRERALASLGIWLGSFLVVIPLLLRLTSIHASGSATAEGESFRGSAWVGAEGFQTTLLLFVVATLIGAVVALLAGVLNPSTLRADIARVARSIQTVPGQETPAGDADSR